MYRGKQNERQPPGKADVQTLIILCLSWKEVTQVAFFSDKTDSRALDGIKISINAAP